MEGVFEIAKGFMENADHVSINDYVIKELSQEWKENPPGKMSFDVKDWQTKKIRILTELLGDSINYCYWYGRHNIRPGGASANTMRQVLDRAILAQDYEDMESLSHDLVNTIIAEFSRKRFPMLEEREKHLRELVCYGEEFVDHVFISGKFSQDSDGIFLFENLITKFPGYGSDIFLKRASLFFIMLNRMFGWFEPLMKTLPVPADYQLPRALESLNCIEYSENLKERILDNMLIPKNSLEECEIRAATILACEEFKKYTGWNISDIDTKLWLYGRKLVTPFHLTITTDY